VLVIWFFVSATICWYCGLLVTIAQSVFFSLFFYVTMCIRSQATSCNWFDNTRHLWRRPYGQNIGMKKTFFYSYKQILMHRITFHRNILVVLLSVNVLKSFFLFIYYTIHMHTYSFKLHLQYLFGSVTM
jgi:hypothetical protein